MNILDNQKIISKLDQSQVAESIALLPDQMRQVLEDARLIKIPREFSQVSQVVVNGMGGSNIGVGIIKSAFGDQIKAPISITPGYGVPAHVNKNTLYLISSYSGTTEEPLVAYYEAKKRKAKIMAITEKNLNSQLAKIIIKDNLPAYMFTPEFNPCGQPRIGLGYSIFGVGVLLAKAGLFKINIKEAKDIIADLEIGTRKLRPASGLNNNSAKAIALNLSQKQPILVGAEFLIGNIRALRNQIAENSKNLASYLTLPDLNHFAMEGLAYPEANKKNVVFLFFDSKLYHPQVQKRSRLTKIIIKKNGLPIFAYELKGESKAAQAFELLQLGSWVSYYLGILNNVDPAKIEWVDWFKKELNS